MIEKRVSPKHLYFFGFSILQSASPRLDGRILEEARLFWNLTIFLCIFYRNIKKIRRRLMCGVESRWRGS